MSKTSKQNFSVDIHKNRREVLYNHNCFDISEARKKDVKYDKYSTSMNFSFRYPQDKKICPHENMTDR